MSFDWNSSFAERVKGMAASEIRELLKLLDRPEIISFAGGIPDPDLFPYDRVDAANHAIITDPKRRAQALQYSVSEGYLPLRQWICDRMRANGVACDPDDVLITNGSQQGLDFLGKLLIGRGERVIVTAPTYLGALQAFSAYQPEYVSVPMDENGVLLEPLEEALKGGAKLLYLVPDFQNPTGVTLSAERRPKIVEMAAKYGVPVVEDAAYEQLRYEGAQIPPLASHAPADPAGGLGGNVIYLGTFSKTVIPGLRVGWTVAPRPLIQKMVLVKQASDLTVSAANQMVMYELVREGFEQHLDTLRDAYRTRRDAMLSAIAEHFPQQVKWNHPQGGMFVWLDLPQGIDGAELLKQAITENNVAFVPGAAFFADRSGRNTCRLSFSAVPPEKIREGIARLGALLRSRLAA